MPFLDFVPAPCNCPLPPEVVTEGDTKSRRAGIGSVWECPNCYRQWKLTQDLSPFATKGIWKPLPEDQWLPSPNKNKE